MTIYVLLGILMLKTVLWLVFISGLIRYWERQEIRRMSALLQSNRDLTDRLMHSEGKTWTPPPRPISTEEEEEAPNREWADL
jgi:hypothetical protein